MSTFSTWFGFKGTIADAGGDGEMLPALYPLSIDKDAFIKVDVAAVYRKILTDVLERTQGIPPDKMPTLFDNCLKSEKSNGLITLLSDGLAEKKELFLIYEGDSINVIREATNIERQEMEAAYKTGKQKPGHAYISFKNFNATDMLKIYSAFEFCALCSLNKSMNLASAVQIKISELRASVSLLDSDVAKAQALTIASALEDGLAIYLDAKDEVTTSKIDVEPTKAALEFLNQKRAFYLGVSSAYISGDQTGGLGTTGENDTKANEKGFKNFFESVIKPVIKALFDKDVTYKSQDFRQAAQGFEALKTFALLPDESLMSLDAQRLIINGMFDLTEKDNPVSDPVEPEPLDMVNPPPGQPADPNAKPPPNVDKK